MKYRIMTLVYTDATPVLDVPGRVVGIVGAGDAEIEPTPGAEKVPGKLVLALVELQESQLVVPQAVLT